MSRLVIQPQNTITDWSKASINMNKNGTVSLNAGASNFVTALGINGKGYLTKAITKTTTGTTHMKITVDGVLKVFLKSLGSDPSGVVGIAYEQLLHSGSVIFNGVQTGFNSFAAKSYPDTTDSAGAMLITQPIYFNSSLMIEISCETNDFSHGYEASYIIM